MDYDEGEIYTSNQQQNEELDDSLRYDDSGDKNELKPSEARAKFKNFIRSFVRGNVFIYRDQLIQNYRRNHNTLSVDLRDVANYESVLNDALQMYPSVYLPEFENAAHEVLVMIRPEPNEDEAAPIPQIQIMLKSNQTPISIRKITAVHVNRLLRVPGIVISQTKTRPKAVEITIKCKTCGTVRRLPCGSAFGGVQLPRKCQGNSTLDDQSSECGLDPYVVVPDKCRYVDQQTLKLQENPEEVPTGEMPRHILLSLDRNLAGKIAPGTRVSVMGISSIFSSSGRKQLAAVGSRIPFIRVVGIETQKEGSGSAFNHFTPEEEETFKEMSRDPEIYSKICNSISPSISGDYTVDIKKAVACLLFGGSRKLLPDGMKLRGDINILLLGDPSTAKSQFLKFVEKVAPISVYTSGKGSSAAGLTASVIKSANGEYVLEGGAMVIADGGVVCIDEFDKMRLQDRVAIHEAMEQQTISIAKAGITTILNSRVSVLAAANPVYGRYDDDRSAAENIDFLPSILSRFDLIFIVRDIRSAKRDESIARHVMSVHMNAENPLGIAEGEIGLQQMTKYIAYCRSRCAPRLTEEAAQVLRNHYVRIRQEMRVRKQTSMDVVPITVRQLEAITRITESIAKMHLCPQATIDHVQEAIRLFKVATLNAATSTGYAHVMNTSLHSNASMKNIQTVQDQIKRRVAIGSRVNYRRVITEFQNQGYEDHSIRQAIEIMVRQGDFNYQNQRKSLKRLR